MKIMMLFRKHKRTRMVKKPDGMVFRSLGRALEHLMKIRKFSEAEMIRECLLSEGWSRMEVKRRKEFFFLFKTPTFHFILLLNIHP